jgi:hypothetical protein
MSTLLTATEVGPHRLNSLLEDQVPPLELSYPRLVSVHVLTMTDTPLLEELEVLLTSLDQLVAERVLRQHGGVDFLGPLLDLGQVEL